MDDLLARDDAVDRAGDPRGITARLCAVGRRLRDHELQRRHDRHVPTLCLGRSARGRLPADQRRRDCDLRPRGVRDARERGVAEPPRPAPRVIEPRLPAWWLEDALAAEGEAAPAPELTADATADVAIVGGGYTGLWTALALRGRDPSLRVTLVEAGVCGSGPRRGHG